MTRRNTAQRHAVWTVWLALGLPVVLLGALAWSPLRVAWLCVQRYESAPRETAEVLHKLEGATLALHITEGPNAGRGCTADTSDAHFAALETGERLEVVYAAWAPGECELAATVERSARLLWLVSGGLGFGVVLLLALGAFLARTFTQPVHPPRRLGAEPHDVRCPACGKAMDEGYVPLLAGLHWRRLGEPFGLPHALGGLPGTVGWRGRPPLHAFRCPPCEILTLQYGRAPRR
jgi:hypothetical protein